MPKIKYCLKGGTNTGSCVLLKTSLVSRSCPSSPQTPPAAPSVSWDEITKTFSAAENKKSADELLSVMFDMLVEKPDPSGRCRHQQRPMSSFQKPVLAWWSSRSPGAERPSGSLSRELRKELGTVSWQRVTVISEMLQPMKKPKTVPILASCYLPGAWSPPRHGVHLTAPAQLSAVPNCHQIEGLSWWAFCMKTDD